MPAPSPTLYPSPNLFPGGGLTTFTQGVLDSYVAWLNEDSQNYLRALARMFEDAYTLVIDQGDPDFVELAPDNADPIPDADDYRPGWSVLLDPYNCPTKLLPFLGQFIGVQVPPGTPDTLARATILGEANLHRGTLAAMTSAAAKSLVGTKFLIVSERTAASGSPDAYHMIFAFLASECPSLAVLIAAVEAQKPGGIQITYQSVGSAWPWNLATGTWDTDTMSWNATVTERP